VRTGPNIFTVEVKGETGLMCQSVGAQQINEAMGSIASNVRQTSAALEELNKATHHLRASVEQLNQEVASFKV
jgi:methyl-accepting chemotaxis protein